MKYTKDEYLEARNNGNMKVVQECADELFDEIERLQKDNTFLYRANDTFRLKNEGLENALEHRSDEYAHMVSERNKLKTKLSKYEDSVVARLSGTALETYYTECSTIELKGDDMAFIDIKKEILDNAKKYDLIVLEAKDEK